MSAFPYLLITSAASGGHVNPARTFSEGGILRSLRVALIAVMIVMMSSMIPSRTWSSADIGAPSGDGARTIVSPAWGSFCQISSVIKGMKGCNRRSIVSSVATIVARVAALSWSGASGARRGLASSIYQSQNSCQMNW
jgi:hypothetical protein